MRLDKEICLGGRFDGRDIVGIRYNGCFIYPNPGSFRNTYTVSITNIDEPIYIRYRACQYFLDREDEEITDWGDGIIDYGETSGTAWYVRKHYYKTPGIYTLTSTGVITHIAYGDCYHVLSVNDLRPDIVEGRGLFHRFALVTSANLALPNISLMTDIHNMFYGCRALTKLNLSRWYTNHMTNMNNLFATCDKLAELDISNFDMTNVTDADNMFFGCTHLKTLRLDNCNRYTIEKIINSTNFPTGTLYVTDRKIFCKRANVVDLKEPDDWKFEYID